MIKKKVLFIRARKETDYYSVPHLGLGLLAAILKLKGHDITVLDYLLFLRKNPPTIPEILEKFKPDVVGISLYTSTFNESLKIFNEIKKINGIPIMIGGPHATLYAEELLSKNFGDYIIRGEAEDIICEIVENATNQNHSLVIDARRPNVEKLPFPDFSSFLNYEGIRVYPLQTSRGCPYTCRFCAVKFIATRKWRKRDIKVCIEEIKFMRDYLKKINTIKIVDDAPTTDRTRFKVFLKNLRSEQLGYKLIIDNMRADSVDEEIVELACKAGADSLCIGVEHANQEVFNFINKGESLDQIQKAAMIIKKSGLKLGLCFIIGLPFDSFEKTIQSALFAKQLGADFIYWNMAHPMKGTELRKWFEQNDGILYPDDNYTSYDYHTLKSPQPVVETFDFPLKDREKAYFAATVMTNQYHLNPKEIYYLFKYGIIYRLKKLVLKAFITRIISSPNVFYHCIARRMKSSLFK